MSCLLYVSVCMRAIRPPSSWLLRLRYVTRRFVFVRNDVFLSVVCCVVCVSSYV